MTSTLTTTPDRPTIPAQATRGRHAVPPTAAAPLDRDRLVAALIEGPPQTGGHVPCAARRCAECAPVDAGWQAVRAAAPFLALLDDTESMVAVAQERLRTGSTPAVAR